MTKILLIFLLMPGSLCRAQNSHRRGFTAVFVSTQYSRCALGKLRWRYWGRTGISMAVLACVTVLHLLLIAMT
ncbi:hypothetical protein O9929_08435 [Vibrio lentus]|nr:hypothetical protein [Vibrio lentus]